MLTLLGSPRSCCGGLTRRESLKVGALSALGGLFSLPNLLRAEEARRQTKTARAKSVILLFLSGGAATQDMVDMKPDAPADIRGEFKPVATNVPGINICEHLPLSTRWIHKTAIVRSVNHKAGCHNFLPAYTGWDEPLTDAGVTTKDTYPPSMGSICELLKNDKSDLPAYVYMPCYLGWGQAIRRPGPYAGFLGKRYDPLFTECTPYGDPGIPEPNKDDMYHPKVVRGEPRIPNSVLTQGMTIDRLNTRKRLVEQLDDQLAGADPQLAHGAYDRFEQRAFSLLTSAKVRGAFDLERVDPKMRDRYGRTLFGQSTLIARQLVEAGVRFVNVTWDAFWDRPAKLDGSTWDTHSRNFPILRELLLPYFDLTYAGLLADLEERGLLDETLVVVMSEMGRTPKIGARFAHEKEGRHHWTYCYSVMLAGGGVRGGTVYGASDAQAGYVKDKPVSPADICATIYECLGIDPQMPVHDYADRPHPVARGGRPITDILT
jgi:hypothetical protein